MSYQIIVERGRTHIEKEENSLKRGKGSNKTNTHCLTTAWHSFNSIEVETYFKIVLCKSHRRITKWVERERERESLNQNRQRASKFFHIEMFINVISVKTRCWNKVAVVQSNECLGLSYTLYLICNVGNVKLKNYANYNKKFDISMISLTIFFNLIHTLQHYLWMTKIIWIGRKMFFLVCVRNMS